MPRYSLESIIVLLLVIWLLGMLFWPLRGLIHLILIVVLIFIVLRYLQGRRPLV